MKVYAIMDNLNDIVERADGGLYIFRNEWQAHEVLRLANRPERFEIKQVEVFREVK